MKHRMVFLRQLSFLFEPYVMNIFSIVNSSFVLLATHADKQ